MTASKPLHLTAERDRLFDAEEWINDGDAVVIKPSGAIAAGPGKRPEVSFAFLQ